MIQRLLPLLRPWLSVVLLPPSLAFAAFAAMRTFSGLHGDPTARAEGFFLALWAGLGLLAAGWASASPRLCAVAGVLAVAAGWAVPAGPTRGAAVAVVVVGALAAAALRRWRRLPPGLGASADSLDLILLFTFGTQLAMRGDRLLPLASGSLVFGDLRSLLPWVAAPSLAALAAFWLGRRHEPRALILALACAATAAAGWDLAAGCGLLALAAARRAFEWGLDRSGPGSLLAWVTLPVSSLVALAVGHEAAFLAVAAGGALGAALAAHGRALEAGPRRVSAAARWLPLAFLGLLGLGLWLSGGAWSPAWGARAGAGLFLLLPLTPWMVAPGLLSSGLTSSGSTSSGLTSSGLGSPGLAWGGRLLSDLRIAGPFVAAVLAAAAVLPRGGSAAGLALPAAGLVLALAATLEGSSLERLLGLQRAWSFALLGLTALAAAYPWLRAVPLREALALLGLKVGWITGPVLVVALAALVGAVTLLAARREWPLPPPAVLGAGLLVLAAAISQASPMSPLLASPVRLTVKEPIWRAEVTLPHLSRVAVDSNLDHGAALPPGTAVARVILHTATGEVWQRPLVAGRHTAEWAARRPDVARQLGVAVPEPWLAWVAPEGGFFAQRYRGAWAVESEAVALEEAGVAPGGPASGDAASGDAASRAPTLEIRRRADLPPEVSLTLFFVGAEP